MAVRRRVAEQHEDWLNLVDAEAPWFSLPVLKRVFPNGLEPTPPEVRAEHKARWYGDDDLPSARLAEDRTEYLEWLLGDVLGWRNGYRTGVDVPSVLAAGVTRHDVTITPSGVYQPRRSAPVGLLDEPVETDEQQDDSPEDRARVLVFVLPAGSDPRVRPSGDTWPATWVQRAALSCRHHRIPLAVVTDGDHVTLVHAPADGATGWGTWRASEFSTERVLLDSFRSLLGAGRFIGTADSDTPEALLAESAGTQAEVTDQLGIQVRRATELLVNAISRANRDRDGALLSGVGPHEVYEAAVTVMMRTVFLLVAEERDLLPVDNLHYQELYAVRTLRESLEKERRENPEVLETRTTAWHRLLATSRAVHSGVHHDELSVPAYGGNLFDPDRFPFLEGRRAEGSWRTDTGTPVPVTDLDVLAILNALLVLRFSSGGVTDTRRLSYRNVSVEQIGHIYERLLDHDAVVAQHVVLGLKGKPGDEPEVGLPDMETELMEGDRALVAWLSNKDAEKAGRRVGTAKQVKALLAKPVDPHLKAGLLQACQGDQTLAARIEPFANLLRLDLRDRPLVFLLGAVYVTETGSRRDSGTAYTTRELAEEVAEHALAPLCYSPGPQHTADTNDWRIRPSNEILALKVCDPAVGSGAILVAACRYLADRLIEAWRTEGDPRAAETATAADDPSRLEVVVQARRLVAEQCCYGVDRNPMAVEMAKLSMWLTTVAKNRPFTFLDHAIKEGDSLLGIWDLDQLRYLHYDIAAGRNRQTPIPGFSPGGDAFVAVEKLVEEALAMRRQMRDIETIGPPAVELKRKLHRESGQRLAVLSTIADVVAGAAITAAGERDPRTALTGQVEAGVGVIARLIDALGTPGENDAVRTARTYATIRLNAGTPDGAPERKPLHWPIAFPEVFVAKGYDRGRFDAMVGNPPFIGGQKITGAAGTDYRNHLIAWLASGARGSADLVAYFFLAAMKITRSLSYLATNTVAQGDTSEVGLTQMIDNGWTIHRAVSSTTWPGDATLEISKLWMTAARWTGEHRLDDRTVLGIDEMLYPASRSGWRKQRLADNADKSFQGSIVLGMGFTMSPEEAQALISRDPRNAAVLFPYLNGEDLNRSPTHTAPRWVINFFDWPEELARQYPECFAVVEQKVKPERQERKPNGEFKKRRPLPQLYWIYAEKRPKLYRTIRGFDRVLAISRISKTIQPVFVTSGQVLSDATVVFAYDDYFHFGVFTSGFHYRWAIRFASSMRTDTRYTPSDVFETFPQSPESDAIATAGELLDSHRSRLMQEQQLGLTAVYNLVHDPAERSLPDIKRLRALHVDLDVAVRDAYGWSDLDLGHGFHGVRGQGVRFTFSPEASDEVLDRLLELNKARYEAEVAAGLHNPGRRTSRNTGRRQAGQTSLLEDLE